MRLLRALVLCSLGPCLVPIPIVGQVGLTGGFGTTGLGGEVAIGIGERVVFRVGAGISGLDATTSFDSIPVELDLPRESYTGGFDIHLSEAFRIGIGIMARPARTSLRLTQKDDPIDLGGRILAPQQLGSLTGVIETWRRAPFALLGFGRHVAPGVGLVLDFGAAYFGEPRTTLRASGGTLSAAELEPLLAAQAADFDSQMKTYMRVWPMLRLAVRFGL